MAARRANRSSTFHLAQFHQTPHLSILMTISRSSSPTTITLAQLRSSIARLCNINPRLHIHPLNCAPLDLGIHPPFAPCKTLPHPITTRRHPYRPLRSSKVGRTFPPRRGKEHHARINDHCQSSVRPRELLSRRNTLWCCSMSHFCQSQRHTRIASWSTYYRHTSSVTGSC